MGCNSPEAELVSKLQSSNDLIGIHRLFSAHLQTFTPHFKISKPTSRKPSRSSKSKPLENPSSIRSLAKQFLPFLHQSLSLLPKRLSASSPKIPHSSALELFDVYRLCLDCLEVIVPELAGKPHAVQVQRIRYIHCLENWELYKEAETEGFSVLEGFNSITNGGSRGRSRSSKARLVPELNHENVDQEFAILVLELVVTLVKCASKRRTKVEADYWRVISLVNESESWFKVLDAKDHEKFHHFLVTNLYMTTLFLVTEINTIDRGLVREFCLVTFQAYKNSSLKDQMFKVAVKICSSLFSLRVEMPSYIIDTLKYIFDFMAAECKCISVRLQLHIMDIMKLYFMDNAWPSEDAYVLNYCKIIETSIHSLILCSPKISLVPTGFLEKSLHVKMGMEATILGFLELAYYCANKCHGTTLSLCDAVAEHLDRLAGAFHEGFPLVGSILKMYASGILVSSSNNESAVVPKGSSRNAPHGYPLDLLHDKRQQLQQVADSLKLFKVHLDMRVEEKKSHQRGAYSSSYWQALKFFCQSLADFIYSNRKEIFSKSKSVLTWDGLRSIQDAFHQFCDIFLRGLSATERESETSGDNYRVISVVVVAALMLSLITNQNMKGSTELVEELILTKWIPAKRLHYLYVSLNNIAVILNREKQLKEATKALKLSSKAVWNYVVSLCEMHENKFPHSHDDLSETAIADFVKEASEKTAFLLELEQEVGFKINGFIGECLENWAISQQLIATLPCPTSLVNKWVKKEYLSSKDAAAEDGTTIYSLLPDTLEVFKRPIEKLLEEEILAYEEKSYMNPRFCRKMQLKIIDILLKEVYETDDYNLKRSKILIVKGKVLRAHGLENLDECIQCLSDSILTLKSIYGTNGNCSSQVHHLLIHAYLLRALCTQEAVPSSELLLHPSEFLQNIHDAVGIWLSPDHGHPEDPYEMSEDMLYIYYQLIDFFLIKGYLDILPPIYDAVIKLFNQKNVPLEKTLSQLWKSRRLSHALCVSPVSDILFRSFSGHRSQLCECAEFWKTCMEELKPLVVGLRQLNDEIKQAASDLITNVPLSSSSTFISSNLCNELSGRLISRGQMIEALSYAKEAHRLRSKLLQQNFDYSIEKITEKFDEDGTIIEKSHFGIQTFKIKKLAAARVSGDFQGLVLTPWNVLACYLESILQVGVIQEILGNASEAEMLFLWGKNVSQFQALPIFEISFSSTLGNLYRKQKLWGLAEKELLNAKKVLTDNRGIISCGKCALLFEISTDKKLGDLFLSSSSYTSESLRTQKMFDARSFYKSAVDKLNVFEWRNDSDFEGGVVGHVMPHNTSFSNCKIKLVEKNDSHSRKSEKVETKRSRRTKKEAKPATQRQDSQGGHNRRITRSTYRSLGETCDAMQGDRQALPGGLSTKHLSSSDGSEQRAHESGTEFSVSDFRSGFASVWNKMSCWHGLHLEAVDCISLNSFRNMTWELTYRKLSLRLLLSIGKFFAVSGNVHVAHELLLQCISVLVRGSPDCSKSSASSLVFWVESIGKHFPGDEFAVERAALIYYICWFALQSHAYADTRKSCCEFSCIGIARIVSLLKLAFVLSREVPLLLQKISRLLAVLYVLSASVKTFALSPSEEGSESWWASYFHQASLGTHLNQQIFSGLVPKQSQVDSVSEASFLPNSNSASFETLGSRRLSPESCEDLEEFVLRFLEGLPSSPVICISLVAGMDADLLRELLHYPSEVRAWILLSHLSSDNQHVIVLPVHTSLQEEALDDDMGSSSNVFKCKDFVKQWQCPWASSVIDDIAPVFKNVLEGNYYSSSEYFLKYIEENTSLWWMHRNRLDECLSKFLQDMEDVWLGAWKYLLLGEWPDHSDLDIVQKKLFGDEERLLQLVLSKKCYVGLQSVESCERDDFENMMHLVFKRKVEKSSNLDQVECMTRKPIILVLDFEVQMLPWESLPILRNQEVYRMPSVGSILVTLDRCCQNHENLDTGRTAFPLLDPLDSYYLLNPDGDLSRTQAEFESWFKDRNIEGKTGTVPTIEELTLALKNHDLFIYFGHGSGTQYIPGHEIQKLEKCAASLLLGCSSGCLYLKGCYIPQGAPISYLQAGSPVIIANLWEVTDKDIDRFGKAMLNAWLRERCASAECCQCDATVNSSKYTKCSHKPRIGSFMGQARDACNLGYLIGASPVCYGVPTCITRKDV